MTVMKAIGVACLGVSVSLLLVLCWHDALFVSIPIKETLCVAHGKPVVNGTCGYDKIVSPWFILSGLIALFGLLSMFGARFYNLLTSPIKRRRAAKKEKRQAKLDNA